jgi:hypothetical protein
VVDQISDTIANHPKFRRRLDYAHESGFRFVLSQRDEDSRELLLTVLAFDVPRWQEGALPEAA